MDVERVCEDRKCLMIHSQWMEKKVLFMSAYICILKF